MLRFRGLRPFLMFTFVLAFAGTGFAFPPGGNGGGNGNGGGGGEEPPPEPAQYYDITILSTVGDLSEIRDMNEYGDFVGWYYNETGDLRPFLYSEGLGMIDLNSVLPADSEWTLRSANAINNSGTIVGAGRLPGDTVSRACRITPNPDGTVTVDDLGKFHPDDLPLTRGINDLGEIAGIYHTFDGGKFIWYYTDATGMVEVDLGLSGNENVYDPLGINNLGQIIGSIATEQKQVYRVMPGTPAEWFDPPVYYWTVSGFNDFGDFVGSADFPRKGNKVYQAAYLHDGDGFIEITQEGSSPTARDVNNNGDVVGSWSGASRNSGYGDKQGFVHLRDFDAVVDLDEAVVGTQGELDLWFSLTIGPEFINDDGVIVGTLWGAPDRILFMLTPIESP